MKLVIVKKLGVLIGMICYSAFVIVSTSIASFAQQMTANIDDGGNAAYPLLVALIPLLAIGISSAILYFYSIKRKRTMHDETIDLGCFSHIQSTELDNANIPFQSFTRATSCSEQL